RALHNLGALSQSFGSQLTGALKGAATSGKSLEDVLRRIGLNLAGMALEQGLSPLRNLASGLFGGLLGGVMPFAKGGIVPFANGGVVSSPTYFPAGKNIGLMGEAGAEATMPLQPTADGRLGVAATGGCGGVPEGVNGTAPDAASFRRS